MPFVRLYLHKREKLDLSPLSTKQGKKGGVAMLHTDTSTRYMGTIKKTFFFFARMNALRTSLVAHISQKKRKVNKMIRCAQSPFGERGLPLVLVIAVVVLSLLEMVLLIFFF